MAGGSGGHEGNGHAACGPLWLRVPLTFTVALVVPLVLLLVNKVNRKMRLVSFRYLGWVFVLRSSPGGLMGQLVWCATTAEQGAAAGGPRRPLVAGSRAAGEHGGIPRDRAMWYLLWPLLPAAVFDPSFAEKFETVDVLPGNRVLFRQRTYEVEWIRRPPGPRRAPGEGRPNIGGPSTRNGGVFPNPAYGT